LGLRGREPRLKRTRLPVLASVAAGSVVALALLLGWGSNSDRVERTFVPYVGPAVSLVPQSVAALAPFSVAEWVCALTLGGAVAFVARTVRLGWLTPEEFGAIVRRAAAWTVLAGSWIAIWFYASWGLAYGRSPLEARLGWSTGETEEIDLPLADLERLAADLVERVNRLYLELHGWPDAFTVTASPNGLDAVDQSVDAGWERAAYVLGLDVEALRSRGPAKRLLLSPAFSVLGLGGFYFPFTGEANVNDGPPEWQLAHTIAHEKAHQRFFAPENEANFMGFVACVSSPDLFVRYAGWLFAQRQALRTLARRDPQAFQDLVTDRLPGVQRDVDASRAFWARYEGPISELSDQVNDAYLRANAVEGGVQSYSRSFELYVRWVRAGRPGALPEP